MQIVALYSVIVSESSEGSVGYQRVLLLLHTVYCGAVVGCADDLPVVNGWSRRLNDSHLVVRCNWTRHEYHLKCVGNTWIGDVINCTLRRTDSLIFLYRLKF